MNKENELYKEIIDKTNELKQLGFILKDGELHKLELRLTCHTTYQCLYDGEIEDEFSFPVTEFIKDDVMKIPSDKFLMKMDREGSLTEGIEKLEFIELKRLNNRWVIDTEQNKYLAGFLHDSSVETKDGYEYFDFSIGEQ